jgi:hypothetical protein
MQLYLYNYIYTVQIPKGAETCVGGATLQRRRSMLLSEDKKKTIYDNYLMLKIGRHDLII